MSSGEKREREEASPDPQPHSVFVSLLAWTGRPSPALQLVVGRQAIIMPNFPLPPFSEWREYIIPGCASQYLLYSQAVKGRPFILLEKDGLEGAMVELDVERVDLVDGRRLGHYPLLFSGGMAEAVFSPLFPFLGGEERETMPT